MPKTIAITKEFDFDAAHWLPNVHHNHKCRRLHGHTYRVVLECRGPIGEESGWLVDYSVIANAWAVVHDRLDHRCLNGIAADPVRGLDAQETILDNPTTENLVHWIIAQLAPILPSLAAVRVYESSTTYAEARVEKRRGAHRPFRDDEKLAAEAGSKGGKSVSAEHRAFSRNPELAAAAGRKGRAKQLRATDGSGL